MMLAHELPYRPNVGIVVFNREGKVWVGQRLPDTEHAEMPTDTFIWQMPQGGIDADEDPEVAARRELFEETGIATVSLLMEAPDWISYDLPKDRIGIALKGKYRGQRQKWFAYRFEGHDDEINILNPPAGQSQEFSDWRWAEIHELPDLIVPFKRPVYEEVVALFAHLADQP